MFKSNWIIIIIYIFIIMNSLSKFVDVYISSINSMRTTRWSIFNFFLILFKHFFFIIYFFVSPCFHFPFHFLFCINILSIFWLVVAICDCELNSSHLFHHVILLHTYSMQMQYIRLELNYMTHDTFRPLKCKKSPFHVTNKKVLSQRQDTGLIRMVSYTQHSNFVMVDLLPDIEDLLPSNDWKTF